MNCSQRASCVSDLQDRRCASRGNFAVPSSLVRLLLWCGWRRFFAEQPDIDQIRDVRSWRRIGHEVRERALRGTHRSDRGESDLWTCFEALDNLKPVRRLPAADQRR